VIQIDPAIRGVVAACKTRNQERVSLFSLDEPGLLLVSLVERLDYFTSLLISESCPI